MVAYLNDKTGIGYTSNNKCMRVKERMKKEGNRPKKHVSTTKSLYWATSTSRWFCSPIRKIKLKFNRYPFFSLCVQHHIYGCPNDVCDRNMESHLKGLSREASQVGLVSLGIELHRCVACHGRTCNNSTGFFSFCGCPPWIFMSIFVIWRLFGYSYNATAHFNGIPTLWSDVVVGIFRGTIFPRRHGLRRGEVSY